MNRLRIAFLVSIGISTAAAQELKLEAVALFALAYDPIEMQDHNRMLLVEPKVFEYVRLRELRYSEGIPPETMDLVGIVANNNDQEASNVLVRLQQSRRVTIIEDAGMEPRVGEWGVWETVEEVSILSISPQSTVRVSFEGISIEALWSDLFLSGYWPSEVRYRFAMRCANCAATEGTAQATIGLFPKD